MRVVTWLWVAAAAVLLALGRSQLQLDLIRSASERHSNAKSAEAEHFFKAPGPSDLRSPCPVLNMLCNHGFLPRDGRGISKEHLQHTFVVRYCHHLSRVAGRPVRSLICFVVVATFFSRFDNLARSGLQFRVWQPLRFIRFQ